MPDLKFPIRIGADVHWCAVAELLDVDIFISSAGFRQLLMGVKGSYWKISAQLHYNLLLSSIIG